MTFREYLIKVSRYHRRHYLSSQGNMRVGQSYFNCLPQELAELFMSQQNEGFRMSTDPFYTDNNLPAFLCWVERNWDNG